MVLAKNKTIIVIIATLIIPPIIKTGIIFEILRFLKSKIETSIDPNKNAKPIVKKIHTKATIISIIICENTDLLFILTASSYML